MGLWQVLPDLSEDLVLVEGCGSGEGEDHLADGPCLLSLLLCDRDVLLQDELREHHLGCVRVGGNELGAYFEDEFDDELVDGLGLVVGLEGGDEEEEVFLEVDEVVVDVLADETDLGGFVELFDEVLEGGGGDLPTVILELVASSEDLAQHVHLLVLFLQLQSQPPNIPQDKVLLKVNKETVQQEIHHILRFQPPAPPSRLIEALQLDLLDLPSRLHANRPSLLVQHLLLPPQLLTDLRLPLRNQPLYQPCCVLLVLNLHQVGLDGLLGPRLFLLVIHHPLQLPVLR